MKRAAIAAAAVLLVLEVALRIVGYAAPAWYQLDTRLGWTLKRHKHGWYFAGGERIAIYINSAEMRDREHPLDKPEGVYRIAVLGDEYSEAFDVPIQRTWWWQLPRALQACGSPKPVEVLNFAVGGYGTAQEMVMLETTAMRYQPDLVLLQFSPNDVMDNSPALATEKRRPFFVLDERGEPHIDDSFVWTPGFDRYMQTRYRLLDELADHSRTYQLGRQLAELAFIGDAHAEDDTAVLRAPHDAIWENAWRVTEAVIGKMDVFSRRNGAQLAVLAIPHIGRVGEALGYPEARLSAFGKQKGFEVVTLNDALQPEMVLPSGRWTLEAHAVTARIVADRLCRATRQPG
ncbi:MAG TPA: SGNH/GDSL hydrolase family protein [Burkholderiales bacterium]|nr:SGNH/GDSL hydrolase family protein [Burkholderiales bacterium]